MKFSSLFKSVFTLKVFTLLLSCVFNLVCYGFKAGSHKGGHGRNISGTAEELPRELQQLRKNLLKAGLIHKVDNSYTSTPNTDTVNKVFKEECNNEYNQFHLSRNAFLLYANNQMAEPKSDQVYEYKVDLNLPQQIEKAIKKCILNNMYEKYAKLSQQFAGKINRVYYRKVTHNENYITILALPVIESVNKLTLNNKSPKDLEEIKEKIKIYVEFQNKCMETVSEIEGIWSDENYGFRNPYHTLKTQFNNLKKGLNGKSCKAWFQDFEQFTKTDVFKKFVSLPQKCRENSGCVQEIKDHLNDPPFPKKNDNNPFYQCSQKRDEAYENCFGKNDTQANELQKILSLIRQKSPAVCEENRLAQAHSAHKECNEKINECRQQCNEKLKSFKTEFLKCFFLPDFTSQAYTTLHQNKADPNKNKCFSVIKEIKKSFEEQAQKPPFHAKKNLQFESLSKDNKSKQSIIYPVIIACDDPLEKEQIEKKIDEIQTECQQKDPQQEEQKQQQPNHLVDPATASHIPSNSSSSSQHSTNSQTGVRSDPFSYGKNNPFRAGDDSKMETQDSQDPSASSKVPFHYDPDRSQSTDNKKTADVSADFDSNNSNSSSLTDSNPYNKPDFMSSSRRGISSTRSSSGNGGSLSSEITAEGQDNSERLTKKIDRGIRKFLSSKGQYGLIDDSPSSGSATSSFLGWLSDQTKKAKKQALNAYDKIAGIGRAEFQRRLQLNDENINLFELQREMFVEACQTHNCGTRLR